MGGFLIPILIAIIPVVVVFIFSRTPKPIEFLVLLKEKSGQSNKPRKQPDLSTLNCRVRLAKQNKEKCVSDVFSVEICGLIHAPGDTHNVTVQITVADLTEGLDKVKLAHSTVKRWQRQDSPELCYKADLGRLPERFTTLTDWMTVAQINTDWLMLPRKGRRNLQFTTSILSRQSGQELACAKCIFSYENPALGHIDLEENIQRTKTLAVTLAFAVSAADNKLFDCEIELIKSWARENIDVSGNICSPDALKSSKSAGASGRAKRKLEKVLNKTVIFFSNGNKVDTYKICRELVEIAPHAERYDILELCLRVAAAKGVATVEELALLKNLVIWLEVDTDRFRTMTERILPADMHAVKDKEIILGVTSDMSEQQTREHLNKEYRKWNARVTNSNPEVRIQADRMLKFIAEARSAYIG